MLVHHRAGEAVPALLRIMQKCTGARALCVSSVATIAT